MKINVMAPMSNHTVYMKSDKYLNEPDKVKEMQSYCDPIPVDLNNGFVPTDKSASDNLEKTEENIGDRFSLGGD